LSGMARRRKPLPHTNHERWLVSYADFITLLFAFFVVMFASAQADHSNAARVAASVRNALDEGQIKVVVSAILGGSKAERAKANAMMTGPGGVQHAIQEKAPAADLDSSLESLRAALKQEIEKGQLQVTLEPRGLVISLREAAFFASGDDGVHLGTYPSVEKIARTINAVPNPVRLEGHTDSLPIHNSRFRSNWELSAARSISMLELLVSRFEVSSGRLAVAGYADTAPLESNDSEQGRARNRRVDIVILSASGARPEPQARVAKP